VVLSSLRWRALLGLLLLTILAQPLLQGSAAMEALGAVIYAFLCMATRAAAGSRSVGPATGSGAPVVWLGLNFVARWTDSPGLDALALAASVALVGLMAWLVVESLLRRKMADADALAGAVFGYVLLAVAWAQVYAAVEFWSPGAFAGPFETPAGDDLLYFSMVTLTTLGYGDVLPVAPMARVLSGMEALVGTLYIAVLIGRIVSEFRPGGAD